MDTYPHDDGTRSFVMLDETIDPVAEYQKLHSDSGHDNESLDSLLKGAEEAATAGVTVPSGRYLAWGAEALAAALQDPYALRTTDDARALVDVLRDHISALAGIAHGLGAWLGAAHERGESGDPGAARNQLAAVADALELLPRQLNADAVPADASPAMDLKSLTTNVTEQLRLRGVATDDPMMFGDTQVQWDLANGAMLILGGSEGWELTSFSGETGTPVAGPPLPYDSFSHPAQIAGIVAQTFGDSP